MQKTNKSPELEQKKIGVINWKIYSNILHSCLRNSCVYYMNTKLVLSED